MIKDEKASQVFNSKIVHMTNGIRLTFMGTISIVPNSEGSE